MMVPKPRDYQSLSLAEKIMYELANKGCLRAVSFEELKTVISKGTEIVQDMLDRYKK